MGLNHRNTSADAGHTIPGLFAVHRPLMRGIRHCVRPGAARTLCGIACDDWFFDPGNRFGCDRCLAIPLERRGSGYRTSDGSAARASARFVRHARTTREGARF